MLQYGWYFDNSKDFSGMKIWKISIYVHLCCSMGDTFDNSKDFSVMKFWQMSIYVHLCPFMLQYGWYFENSKDFSVMKFWQMFIYVHLCCSMGDILIIQKILVWWNFDKCSFMFIYAAVWVIFW